jgi:hypothetical protein
MGSKAGQMGSKAGQRKKHEEIKTHPGEIKIELTKRESQVVSSPTGIKKIPS